MRRPLNKSRPVPLGISVDDVLPWQALGPRLGLGKRARADAAKAGLKSVTIGRCKYTTGKWLAEFIERLAEKQAEEEGGGE